MVFRRKTRCQRRPIGLDGRRIEFEELAELAGMWRKDRGKLAWPEHADIFRNRVESIGVKYDRLMNIPKQSCHESRKGWTATQTRSHGDNVIGLRERYKLVQCRLSKATVFVARQRRCHVT